jgi:ATP-dependent Clp protease ATP-binding subunit ClpA
MLRYLLTKLQHHSLDSSPWPCHAKQQSLSARYIADPILSDKAIEAMHEAGARAR